MRIEPIALHRGHVATLAAWHHAQWGHLYSHWTHEVCLAELKKLDQVAYVRFASVYRRFADVADFREEIERLERDLPGMATEQLPLLDEPVRGSKR